MNTTTSTYITKTNLLYDIMLVANDDDSSMRQDRRNIAQVFEDITGQDLPENGWMVDEMAINTGISTKDLETLIKLVREYWEARN